MCKLRSFGLVMTAVLLSPLSLFAQAAPQLAPAVPPAGVAALVNGQPLPESLVRCYLDRFPPDRQASARAEYVDHLIENILLEQYLQQINVVVDKKKIEKSIQEFRDDLKKRNTTLEEGLKEMKMSEAQYREELTAEMRFETYAESQSNDKVLRELFESSKDLFNGTQVRARHILLTPAGKDANSLAATRDQIMKVRKEIETKVAVGLAKLPAGSDKLAVERERMRLLEDAFMEAARTYSTCSTSSIGGDVGSFQGVRRVAEPFARAAFALKPYEMSEPVLTSFGYHLILPIERRQGTELKFEQAKEDVKEVYWDRLRANIVTQVKAKSKIVVNPMPQ